MKFNTDDISQLFASIDITRASIANLSSVISENAKSEVKIRYVKEEASALTFSIIYSIDHSIAFIKRLNDASISAIGRRKTLLMSASDYISNGNVLMAAIATRDIGDIDFIEHLGVVTGSWQETDKMIKSYFTPREIAAIEEKVPFIHNQTFSYDKKHAEQISFIDIRHSVEDAVYKTIIDVENEDLKGKLLNSGQLEFNDMDIKLFLSEEPEQEEESLFSKPC